MDITSRSYNFATHKYEDWGTDDNGRVVHKSSDVQLELELPPPIQHKPPVGACTDGEDDACTSKNCK